MLPLFWLPTIIFGLFGAAVILDWDNFIAHIKGKKLAILGARAVGKSHLFRFLSSGSISISEDHGETKIPTKVTGRRLQMKDLDFKVMDSVDVSGGAGQLANWKERVDDADIVLYLLKADRLIAGDEVTEHRVKADLVHIGRWLDEREKNNSRPHFVIVGTHCDLDPTYAGLTVDTAGTYLDQFRELPIMSELINRGGGGKKCKIALGSMRSIRGTEQLVYELFKQVMP